MYIYSGSHRSQAQVRYIHAIRQGGTDTAQAERYPSDQGWYW